MTSPNETKPAVAPSGLNVGLDILSLRIGDKVCYKPQHYDDAEFENGIIKEIRSEVTDSIWVVYNCAGNWDNYQNYTSAKTNLRDLEFGWRY